MNKQSHILSEYQNKSLFFLIVSLISITLIYQLRPFLDDAQFAWISVPSYSVIPGLLVAFSIILAVKLRKQNHYQYKAFVLFAIGASCWFTAEQIWAIYDHVFNIDPFPSIADFFFTSAYPFYILFLFISLKPIRSHISKKVWLFAIVLSLSILIPSITAYLETLNEETAFDQGVALLYPILSSVQLVPALVGVLFLAKKKASYTWILLLFGFIMYAASDTFFLFTQIDESYYDGHPVDLMFLYSFLLLLFSMHSRMKIMNSPQTKGDTFFSEHVQFETISKFGIPLTLIIISMITVIFLFSEIFFNEIDVVGNTDNPQNAMLMIIFAMLLVFCAIVLTLNQSLTKLVRMRTHELEKQKNDLQHIVAEKQDEVLKAERLSAIGELSGRLAHDLRNPLSVMKMSIDLIKQHPADAKLSDSIITKRLDLIEKSIERISHQVDDVLGYVRNSPLKLSAVSVRSLLLSAIDKVNVPLDIKINLSENDQTISCDVIKMDAVFINLIVNAIQAMTEGGKIDIKISSEDDYVMIEFIDSGPGIPVDSIDKIFEPLFTTKQKGTGLGLASCKNIVEQHGGQISVKNNPTTFTIVLPKMIHPIYAEHV